MKKNNLALPAPLHSIKNNNNKTDERSAQMAALGHVPKLVSDIGSVQPRPQKRW
jgi:hypothetical protein